MAGLPDLRRGWALYFLGWMGGGEYHREHDIHAGVHLRGDRLAAYHFTLCQSIHSAAAGETIQIGGRPRVAARGGMGT